MSSERHKWALIKYSVDASHTPAQCKSMLASEHVDTLCNFTKSLVVFKMIA